MIALDSGLLALAANRFALEHARAATLLESLAEGDAPWALTWSGVHEFLGFVTHPHAVARVLGPREAWGFIEALTLSPSLHLLGPTERHAAVCAEVLSLAGPDATGGLDPSFTTAVILREHGVREILSTDTGLERWRFLEVRDPFKADGWTPTARPARRYRTLAGRKSRG